MKNILVLFLVLFSVKGLAQLDSIQYLNVVNLQSITLHKHSKGFKVVKLSDSIIINNVESFSSLLRFNSPIYIKEYGSGGTSSVSFRGTNASNTAVVWNGININSINNGQSEFNSLNVSLFESIDIRSGGGSIEFGSGAVGGTIHLNDQIKFGNHIENQLYNSYGSYNTTHNLYKFSFGNERTAVKFGAAYNKSDNDYKWLGYDLKNENGQFKNTDLSLAIAQKVGQFSKFSFYSSKYNGSRNFSGELPNPSAAKEKYKDLSLRNLVDFNYHKNEFNHTLSLAYLTQEYQYFGDKNINSYNYGKSKRFLTKYNVNYKISGQSSIQSFSEYESTLGKTDQMIERNRKQFSQSVIFSHQFDELISLNTKVRKDFNSDYNIPFVFAAGMDIHPLKNIFIRVNGSKNYKVPSYNDLYWPSLGNENLIPESSKQGEFGIVFKNKSLKIDVGTFYIDTKDKIVWRPGGDPNRPSVWVPINIDEVVNKGAEFTFDYKTNFENHFFNFRMNYSYTISENKITKNLLPYIPKHLMNGSIGYTFKKWNVYYQHLFNGKIFTTEDTIDLYSMPYFNVGNLGVNYSFQVSKESNLGVGFKINNVSNQPYKVLPGRPMPNRNINININYKF